MFVVRRLQLRIKTIHSEFPICAVIFVLISDTQSSMYSKCEFNKLHI